MTEPIKTIPMGPITINILPDIYGDQECPLDTLTEADGIKFLTWDRRSVLSSPPYNEFSKPNEAIEFAKKNRYEVFPLLKYEHGLVAYSTKSFHGRAHHAEWDSGQTGFVLVKKSDYPKKKRAKIAESWCKAMTTWVNNDYYGYEIVDENDNDFDACWGFDDLDYCEQEARRTAKVYLAGKKVQIEDKFADDYPPTAIRKAL